ncbi:MAG: beta-galactosidase [Armatimonadota bacterium]|nr:beta-galactosidase [Armatimonadota bacterium]
MKISSILMLLLANLFLTPAFANPLTIDLTTAVSPPVASPYGPGAAKDPQGHELTLDSRSFFLDGKPWVPVLGEFHYARYPRSEWRDELLKMKAGGINTVSTYVFWIHHEEEQGKFDWTGRRALRDFLKLCQDGGLKAFVRMGPWCHGEVRNGGFPDWVQNSNTGLRSKDPRFMALVEPFFREQAKQMQGLLWKDGGPVIGIQLDNENDRADYLLALKQMARTVGVDVPFYAITGWQGGLPATDLIPLFGGYSDGFWGGSHEDYRKEYLFTDVRAMNDLGAQLTTKNPVNSQLIAQFPYACVEIGGGMMSSYGKRIRIVPANIAALALSKLGNGNNMPGYYMFQGGTNPDGKLSYLNEDHPNQLPIKNYDFQAPLGSAGQVREQYHLLRQQHLFLQDFGAALAQMPAYFPDKRPANLQDFETLRWDVRSDGRSGFLFFNNQQPYEPLPEHKDVQFELKTGAGSLLIPHQPMTVPSGSYGFFPFNLDCDGVTLEYATAQPLCHLVTTTSTVCFLTALDGIAPELVVRPGQGRVLAAAGSSETRDGALRVYNLKCGTAPAVTVTKAGRTVLFVVLTPEQGRHFWRLPFAGRDCAILSEATVLPDEPALRLQAEDARNLSLSVFPRVASITSDGRKLAGRRDGIFTHFAPPTRAPVMPIPFSIRPVRPAGPRATKLMGTDESAWEDAAVYRLNIPPIAANRRLLLNIHYTGDAARLIIDDKLVDDDFYNGDPFSMALWRIPPTEWPTIQLKLLPFSDGLMGRLPAPAQAKVNEAKAAAAVDTVSITSAEQLEWRITPASAR